MTALPKRQYISPEEYLTAERESLEKHEYFDGEIFLNVGFHLGKQYNYSEHNHKFPPYDLIKRTVKEK